MRTTVTLDADVDALLKVFIQERGLSFKQGLNEALRMALRGHAADPAETTPTFDMGRALVNIDKATQIAGMLEDEEFLRIFRERDEGR